MNFTVHRQNIIQLHQVQNTYNLVYVLYYNPLNKIWVYKEKSQSIQMFLQNFSGNNIFGFEKIDRLAITPEIKIF